VENSSPKQSSLTPLISFLKARYEPAHQWTDQQISDYLEWAAQNGFLFVARNDDESVAGVALARPVSSYPETLDEFDITGRNAHINFMVASARWAFQLLGFTIIYHFGNCDTITFQRHKHGKSQKKSYSRDHVRRTLFNLRNHHG